MANAGPVPSEEIRAASRRLIASAEALAALGAAMRLRVTRTQTDDATAAALAAVIASLGLTEALDAADPDTLAAELGFVDAFVRQAADLLGDPVRAPGWSYTDLAVLRSQGTASASFPTALAAGGALLPGLPDALALTGARFLDVGVGVAGLSIAMCRHWPDLGAVGIDPWEPAIGVARHDVAAAGLAERIELRVQRVEELADEAVFDLVWLPGPFLGPAIIERATQRGAAATRPGGWVLLAQYGGADPLAAALGRLRAIRSGGTVLDPQQAEALLRSAQLEHVRTLPAEFWPPGSLTAGRRRG